MEIEVWSDVVCPWCYIGKRRLETAIATFDEPVELVYRSFELDPNAPAIDPDSSIARLAEKYNMSLAQAEAAQQRVSDVANGEGLTFRLREARRGNSFDAHRLLHLARERGLQVELKERLMAAYFTEGQAIGDPVVLQELAVEAGLDPGEVADVLAGDRFADAVRADEREAAELGIHGVPFFVFDRRVAVEGAQPAEQIVSAMQHTREQVA